MPFLLKKDYYILIDEEDLDVVSYSSDNSVTAESVIEETEQNVIQEVGSYLNNRYDVSKIFTNVLEWLRGETYQLGQLIYLACDTLAVHNTAYPNKSLITRPNGEVWLVIASDPVTYNENEGFNSDYYALVGQNNSYYTALVNTNVGDYPANPVKFSTGDTRNALIKRHVINIVLYELHSRINPRNIPEFRIQRRDDSIKWLTAVQNPRNNVNADFLPMRDFGAQRGNDISWGSNPKITHRY